MNISFKTFIIWLLWSVSGEEQTVSFNSDTDPLELTRQVCEGKRISCARRVLPLIELRKTELYGGSLNWTYHATCGCLFPRQERLDALQYLHIPKAGTAINWFLHDYFHCSGEDEVSPSPDPCPRWLETAEEQREGLCGGRLFSCMGHSVNPLLPALVVDSEANLIVFLRSPWVRIQSDFHYSTSRPSSGHLGPNMDLKRAVASSGSAMEYALYPGIANCATKMLNGYYCGDSVNLTWQHLDIAKRVLDNSLFVGITDFFRTSLCQLVWTYGGELTERHFRKSREGSYARVEEESLGEVDRQKFRESEKFDLALFEYALSEFTSNLEMTNCPNIDKKKSVL